MQDAGSLSGGAEPGAQEGSWAGTRCCNQLADHALSPARAFAAPVTAALRLEEGNVALNTARTRNSCTQLNAI